MLKETAYELEVEIIKDYANVQKDIQDVLDLMEKGENYKDTVQKVNTVIILTRVLWKI